MATLLGRRGSLDAGQRTALTRALDDRSSKCGRSITSRSGQHLPEAPSSVTASPARAGRDLDGPSRSSEGSAPSPICRRGIRDRDALAPWRARTGASIRAFVSRGCDEAAHTSTACAARGDDRARTSFRPWAVLLPHATPFPDGPGRGAARTSPIVNSDTPMASTEGLAAGVRARRAEIGPYIVTAAWRGRPQKRCRSRADLRRIQRSGQEMRS